MSVRAKIVDSGLVSVVGSPVVCPCQPPTTHSAGGGDSFGKLSAQTNRNESQMNITQVQLNGHK